MYAVKGNSIKKLDFTAILFRYEYINRYIDYNMLDIFTGFEIKLLYYRIEILS